jgi:DNA-binding Lrp family transcriptional regulator
MDPLLELLQKNARLTDAQLAEQLDSSIGEVSEKIASWEADGTILGYQAVIDSNTQTEGAVTAMIEVKVTPERGGGFDRLAQRIAKFDQVASCYLVSGGYDLAVWVRGRDLHEVAKFVAEKLSTIEGVLSTATHFQLKVYKQNGLLANGPTERQRLAVAP